MTSNLIAYWRNENERQAQERAYLLDRYKTQMEERRQEREEKWRALNYDLERLRLNTQQKYNEAQLEISRGQMYLQNLSLALDQRRQGEVERSNAAREAQAERERVTQSFLKQKELQDRARQESARNRLTEQSQKINMAGTVLSTGLQLAMWMAGSQVKRK